MGSRIILILMLTLTACTGAKVEIKLGKGKTGVDGISDSWITIQKFQSLEKKDWIVDARNRLMTNQNILIFNGKCERSVSMIQLQVNGKDSGSPAVCNLQQEFEVRSDTLDGPDGPIEVRFETKDLALSALEPTVSRSILVDRTGPSAPIVTTNSGISPYASPDSTLTLNGTIDYDTYEIIVTGISGTGRVDTNNGIFTFNANLIAGTTYTLSIKGKDRLGNESSATSFTVSYGAERALASSGFQSVGLSASIAGTQTTLQSAAMDPNSDSGTKTDSPSGLYQLLPGFIRSLFE